MKTELEPSEHEKPYMAQTIEAALCLGMIHGYEDTGDLYKIGELTDSEI
jgi:hypothetical protein